MSAKFSAMGIRWGRLLLFGAALVGIQAAVAEGTPAPVTWRRHVSAPLADGTRVTFLYPASLRAEVKPTRGIILSRPASLLCRMRRASRLLPSDTSEYIVISGRPVSGKISAGKSAGPHTWRCGNGGPPRGWDVTLMDPATHRAYGLGYRLSGDETGIFEARRAVIEKSFRVLRRGEEIPADYPLTQGGRIYEPPPYMSLL